MHSYNIVQSFAQNSAAYSCEVLKAMIIEGELYNNVYTFVDPQCLLLGMYMYIQSLSQHYQYPTMYNNYSYIVLLRPLRIINKYLFELTRSTVKFNASNS